MSETNVLVRYTETEEENGPVITYYSDIDDLHVMEICKISVNEDLLAKSENKNMTLLQLLVTPHVHNSLLGAIIPFVEKMLPLVNLETQNSLNNWLVQANDILGQST
jgi:hypothetical protein